MTQPWFGTELAKLRAERGMTQQQLATLTGVEHSTISRLESGDRLPSLEFMARLSRTLGLRWNRRRYLLNAAMVDAELRAQRREEAG